MKSVFGANSFEVEWKKLIEAIYLFNMNMKGIPIAIGKAERKEEKTIFFIQVRLLSGVCSGLLFSLILF